MTRKLYGSFGGGLSTNVRLLRSFLAAQAAYPEWFNPALAITSVFDSILGLVWNGGRPDMGEAVSFAELKQRVAFFNELNIGVYFTFSNLLLSEKHLTDKDCNQVLAAFANPLNGCIVGSDLLVKHIRQNYPQYRLVLSVSKTTEPQFDEVALLKAASEYDLVVFPARFNREIDFLKRFPAEKIELLADEVCPLNCPHTQKHYLAISQYILDAYESKQTPDRQKYFLSCVWPEHKQRQYVLSLTEILAISAATGITHFKFATREFGYGRNLETLCRYFVWPDHWKGFQEYMRFE
jgi:hypothetical protein